MRLPESLLVERTDAAEDIDAVAALEDRAFTNPWTRDMLAAELARSDFARLYVLRLPGHGIVGFCSCWIVGDELHVNTIAVDAPHRRAGLGQYLMREVMRQAAACGVRRATLEVRESNLPARRMYGRLGFTVAGVRRGYYTAPEEDALILWHNGLASHTNVET
jgi:[ribosomal protein S18]-alanine N-acetyltransferase